MKYYPQWRPGAPCPNNDAVVCPDHSKCSRCGWNPKVAEKRMETITKELQQKRRSSK